MASEPITTVVIDDDLQISLVELCRAVQTPQDVVRVWVVEGVLEPLQGSAPDWRFTGAALHRARLAATLARDLEVNPAGIALALDLMDEIAALRAALRRSGGT